MKSKKYIVVFFIITIVFVLHSVFLCVPAEDSFISFHYAQNLTNGHDLVWNAGEVPVEGYTNFLWILICSVVMMIGQDVILFSQIIGIICGVLILLYSYLFSRKILSLNNSSALLAPALLAFSGPLAVWSSSGMETSLFSLLVLTAAYYSARYSISRKKSFIILSFVICFLATLTRPEGFGIFILLFAFQIITILLRKEKIYISRIVITGILAYFIPFLIYFIWRFNYYGELLPLTFYAKTGGGIYQWIRGLRYLFFFSFHFILPLAPIVLLYFWQNSDQIRNVRSVIRKSFTPEKNKEIGISLLLFLTLCYTIYLILIGGDYMAIYRFFVPILAMIYLLIAVAYNQLYHAQQTEIRKKKILALVLVFSFIFTFIQSTPIEIYLFEKPGITHGQYRGVLTEKWHSNRLTLIGKFFNEYKKNKDESLATDAIGAISYYSNMKIYGMHGLDDPVIAKMDIVEMGRGFPGHEKLDIEHILSKEPTYFMFSRELTEKEDKFPEYSPGVDTILKQFYDKVAVWLNDTENNESGYFTFLQRKKNPIDLENNTE